MKLRSIRFTLFIFLGMMLAFAARVQGQQPPPPPGGYDHLPGLDDAWKAKIAASDAIRPVAREPRVIEQGPLAVSEQDRNYYAALLALPNTGLIRLLPRDNPKSAFNYAGERPAIRGGGSDYSFHYRSHEYGHGSDLELSSVGEFRVERRVTTELPPHYNFSVGLAGADFGLLTNVGNVSLLDLTAADPRAGYLFAYETPQKESEARAEYQRVSRGVTIDGQAYKKILPIQSNATYLLRTINYDVSDLLVAFQVVRQESDGSVIIAWKLLKNYAKPQLARNK
jgi:hypothetical protein